MQENKQSQYIVKIIEIEDVTHDVKKFKVEKPSEFKFIPGQATEVAVNQEGYSDKFHPFTFTSLNSEEYLEFTIKGYPVNKYPTHSGVTEKIHTLRLGDELIINDPFGTINYTGKGIFLAGGAGLTPFIAIFRDLKNKGELEGNKLIYSNKTSQDIIIENELRAMFGKDELILTLTREEKEGYEKGRIDKEMIKKYVSDFSQKFYVCGPKEFVKAIVEYLKELGAHPESIVIEE